MTGEIQTTKLAEVAVRPSCRRTFGALQAWKHALSKLLPHYVVLATKKPDAVVRIVVLYDEREEPA